MLKPLLERILSRRFLALVVLLPEIVSSSSRNLNDRPQHGGHWVDTWACMQQLTEPRNLPPQPYTAPDAVFRNVTIRTTIRPTLSGETIRLHVSNTFGGTPLSLSKITVSNPIPGSSKVKAGSSIISEGPIIVKFKGQESAIVPPGQIATSDPVDFRVIAEYDISISIYLKSGQSSNNITSHAGSRTTSWFAFGDHTETADISRVPQAKSVAHWYFICTIDTLATKDAAAFVIVGDSLSDGRGSQDNMNNRWPDLLVRRLQNNPTTQSISVINQAAGGNRVLQDGLGPAAISRIGRDVLDQSGVKFAMIFEGVNDIGTAPSNAARQNKVGDDLIAAYEKMIRQMHSKDIRVFGGTITPIQGQGQSYGTVERENTRQRVNEWIRRGGKFDGVVDFDLAVKDHGNSCRLSASFDTGDHLHLNPAGYQAMADSFDIGLFTKK